MNNKINILLSFLLAILLSCGTKEDPSTFLREIQFVVPDAAYEIGVSGGLECEETGSLTGIGNVKVDLYESFEDLVLRQNVISTEISDENGFISLEYAINNNSGATPGANSELWAIASVGDLSSIRASEVQSSGSFNGFNYLNLSGINSFECSIDQVVPLSLFPSRLNITILDSEGNLFDEHATVKIYPTEETYANDTSPEEWPESDRIDLGGITPGSGDFLFTKTSSTGQVFYSNLAPKVFWFRVEGIDGSYNNDGGKIKLDQPLLSSEVTTSITVSLSKTD
ncbi:hypothetical protein [Ekhidna sp.]|uniref:hypothetical protein n=1 Tax=Ekhidna sp. TaxID=2608089 RepID=UPI003C7A4DC8